MRVLVGEALVKCCESKVIMAMCNILYLFGNIHLAQWRQTRHNKLLLLVVQPSGTAPQPVSYHVGRSFLETRLYVAALATMAWPGQ